MQMLSINIFFYCLEKKDNREMEVTVQSKYYTVCVKISWCIKLCGFHCTQYSHENYFTQFKLETIAIFHDMTMAPVDHMMVFCSSIFNMSLSLIPVKFFRDKSTPKHGLLHRWTTVCVTSLSLGVIDSNHNLWVCALLKGLYTYKFKNYSVH